MKPFPFEQAEWRHVQELTSEVLNATLMDDAVLQTATFENLRGYLQQLRSRYGNHPILVETEADFAADPLAQKSGYEEAIEIAREKRLPTLSIRLSLARLLIEELNNCTRARVELLKCESELANAETSDIQQWDELMRKCRR